MTISASQYQLQGQVKFGTAANSLTSVAVDVFACTFTRTCNSIERPGTFSNPRNTTYAGTYNETIEIEFASAGEYSGTTLAGMINTAVLAATPTNLLYFSFNQSEEANATTNVQVTGSVSVLEAKLGGEVGTLRRVTLTLPVNSSTFTTT